MNKRFLSTPVFLFLTILSTTIFSQEAIRFKSLRASDEDKIILDQHFQTYTLAHLNTDDVDKMLRTRDYFPELSLEAGGQTFRFNLLAHDIRAPHYKLRAMTADGMVEYPRSPNKTYFGYTKDGHHSVRLTADGDFFNCVIAQHDDLLHIEPVRNIIPGSSKDDFVIYWSSDNLKAFTGDKCGVHNGVTFESHPDEQPHDTQSSGQRACKEVDIALADDVQMFNQYGSVGEVEDHNLAVINNVQLNYDFEFNDDLEFDIVEIYVATSESTDPWTNSNDPNALLDDFTEWGPNGFDNTHDVASLWSARNFNGPTIGLAWLDAVCTSVRYNVLEDFSSNADLLRVLQAHELGHNFGSNHDPEGSNTIMAPSVSNTNNWSSSSITQINNYINSINCLGSCGVPQPPVADFDADPTEGCTPLVVQYDDQSTNNPTSWQWTFEGGTPPTSSNQNPVVTYNSPGTFNVTLTVSNNVGSDTETFVNFITVNEEPFADFDYFIDEWTVDFENQSGGGGSYFWEFGDGGTSTLENPIHVYDEDGVYTVTLSVTNECGTDEFTQIIEIVTEPFADFFASETEGCAPMEVSFTNLSSDNADFFEWEFPGGSPSSSTAFEPTVIYDNPGTYNVSLTVINEAGEDTYTLFNYITIFPEPVAVFDYLTNGLQVNFDSDGSIGDTYFWNFGDGETSTSTDPSHTYDAGGNYNVTLTVTNDCGTDVFIQNISITGAPEANFGSNTQYGCAPLLVQFTNQSGGAPTSFAWVFEGGTPATSSQPNPLVTYHTPGVFDVQLTVTNSTGSDVLLLPNYIEVESPTDADLSFSINGSNVFFSNQSTNETGTVWHFGDGETSTDENPVHVYSGDGTYTVMLVALGVCGNDTATTQVTIQTPPQADFSLQVSGNCVPVTVEFTNESSPNATSFQWSFPGGNPSSSSQENPVVTYSNAGTYTVTLIAVSGGGSDTLTMNNIVTIGSVPDASFFLSNDQTTVSLTNASDNATSYFWMFGDGQTSTEQDPVHEYASFGVYTITLIATNACGDDTTEVTIELSTVPNAFFGYSTHTGCAPFQVQFIDQSQNNPTAWLWTFEGGEPATSALQHPVVTYNVPGVYNVSLEVSNSEGTDAILLSGLIQVGGVPDATFAHTQHENTVSLEYQGLDYDSLRWDFGDGRTDNSLNPTVEYTVSGTYQIILTVYNPCGTDTSSIWVTIIISTTSGPQANPHQWEVRPNPFEHQFTIFGLPGMEGTAQITLYDLHGRQIQTGQYGYTAGQTVIPIKANELPNGVILVQIREASGTTILRAIKQ